MKENDATLDAAFDAAFDEALTGTPPTTITASEQEGIDMGTTPPADEPTVTEPPAGGEPVAVVILPAPAAPSTDDGVPAPVAPPVTPPVTPPAPAGPTAEERVAALEAQLAEANAKLAAPPAPAPAPVPTAPPAPAPPAAPEPVKLDTAEQAEFDEYTSNWPDHAKALALSNKLLQKQVEQLISAGMQQVTGKVQELMAPMMKTVTTVANKSFRDVVMGSHSDLDEVLPKVKTWIEGQPAYLRPALEETMRSAPAEHVVDLISRAKKELGIPDRPSGPAPSAPAAPPVPPAPDPDKNKRLDRMEAVDGGASKPTRTGADPLDYDSAFDEAANRLTK